MHERQYIIDGITIKDTWRMFHILAELVKGFEVMPGGFGTLDELFESLTLIRTKRIRAFPVILMDSGYWKGLIDWMKEILIKEKTISESDIEIFSLVDTPEEAVSIIKRTVVV